MRRALVRAFRPAADAPPLSVRASAPVRCSRRLERNVRPIEVGLTDVVDAEIDVASTLVCAADGCVDSAPAVEAEGPGVPAPLEDVGCAAAGAALGSAEGAAVGAGAVVGGGSSGDRDGRSVSGST